jgi:hypothetical protein
MRWATTFQSRALAAAADDSRDRARPLVISPLPHLKKVSAAQYAGALLYARTELPGFTISSSADGRRIAEVLAQLGYRPATWSSSMERSTYRSGRRLDGAIVARGRPARAHSDEAF